MYFVGSVLSLTLFWFLRKKAHWAISTFFAITGGTLFAYSFLGGWATSLVTWTLEFALGLFPEPVPVSTVLAALCLAVVVLVGTDVWKDRKLDSHGQWAAICLPVLLLAAGGAVGSTGTTIVGALADAGTGVFGPLLGW